MKKIKNIILVLFFISISFVCTRTTVQAASYPLIYLDSSATGLTHYVGDNVKLVFNYLPEYHNEIIHVKIFDSNNNEIAYADKQFYNYDGGPYVKEYTVSWDTTDYSTGLYRVNVTSEFYSLFRWNVSPRSSNYYISLRPQSEKPDMGWHKTNGKWWYVFNDGSSAQSEWAVIDGNEYYFDDMGYMTTGWLYWGDNWYYLNSSGVLQTGWIKVGDSWYYGDDSGRLYEEEWLDDTYYFKSGAAMATGWCKIDGEYYYFNASGEKVTNAWVGDYYLKSDGLMAVSEWVDNNRSYVNSAGEYVKGWLKYEGSWYYLGLNGVLQTGWIKVGDSWYYGEAGTGILYENEWLNYSYYFKSGGEMATGWYKIDGEYYYFRSTGEKVTNMWIGDYYLKADGIMAKNEWINGYYVGADGAWIPEYVA